MFTEETREAECIAQLPTSLRTLLTLERFHLHNAELFQDRSRDPEFDTRYFPQNCGVFRLPCFWVDRNKLQLYGVDTELSMLSERDSKRVLFPIHPSSLPHVRQFLVDVHAQDAATEGVCIWALPTSSTRTLLAWPDSAPERAIFVKTSLHTPIFGDRRLYLRKIARSVGLSQLVQLSDGIPDALSYFPEPLGFAMRRAPDSGIVIRSIPNEIKDSHIVVAPLFSLFGGTEARPPLLITLLARTGMSPLHFAEQVLCIPFAKMWLQMTMRLGIILEAHAQDILLALSPDLYPLGRFYYRDFEGLQVDWELRRAYGLPMPASMPRAWAWHETYATLGYPGGQLAWYQYHISLFGYLHFVLHELEQSVHLWRARGWIDGPPIEADAVTMIFSRHVLSEISKQFDVRVGADFNVYRSLKKFMILLMKIRKALREGAGVRNVKVP